MLAICAGGLLIGAIWRGVLPAAAGWGGPGEGRVAADGALALLQLVAGVLTGVGLQLRPGEDRLRRAAVGLAAGLFAGTLAALAGWALGAPLPLAPGAALVWPVATAGTLFLASCVSAFLADPVRDGDVDSPA